MNPKMKKSAVWRIWIFDGKKGILRPTTLRRGAMLRVCSTQSLTTFIILCKFSCIFASCAFKASPRSAHERTQATNSNQIIKCEAKQLTFSNRRNSRRAGTSIKYVMKFAHAIVEPIANAYANEIQLSSTAPSSWPMETRLYFSYFCFHCLRILVARRKEMITKRTFVPLFVRFMSSLNDIH